MSKFYVYMWLNKDWGGDVPFYVGKGYGENSKWVQGVHEPILKVS